MKAARNIPHKICSRVDLKAFVNRARLLGKKIVFTNGVFDILHQGHIKVLTEAAVLGDVLIVGLNSDGSVKRLKGKERPVNQEECRALILASLVMVDVVVIFEEDTPLELIKLIVPDVLVKGGDYTKNTIVGAEIVESGNGQVVVVPLEEGFSTTSTINKLKGYNINNG